MVVADLPKAGLGNKLFVWAKAKIFAEQHQLPLLIKGLNQINLGTFFRMERVKRFYLGQFKFSSPLKFRDYYKLKNGSGKMFYEDDGLIELQNGKNLYIFNQIPSWADSFAVIRDHRELIIPAFYNLLSGRIQKMLVDDPIKPVIGVHIRMGDFKKLAAGQDFKTVGGVRTPLKYFIDCITGIREKFEQCLPVTIFSDGYPNELQEVLQLPGVSLAPPAADVIDIIRLSKSKIIVTSAGSTFGEWAGYLSEAAIIRHPDHMRSLIRSEKYHLFEGTLESFCNKTHSFEPTR